MSSDVNLQYQTRDIHRQEEKEVEERHELYNEPLSLDATRLKTVWGLFVVLLIINTSALSADTPLRQLTLTL